MARLILGKTRVGETWIWVGPRNSGPIAVEIVEQTDEHTDGGVFWPTIEVTEKDGRMYRDFCPETELVARVPTPKEDEGIGALTVDPTTPVNSIHWLGPRDPGHGRQYQDQGMYQFHRSMKEAFLDRT
jgi:hypothetical protein